MESQELEFALINYNKAIEIKSDFADAYCYKGVALTGLKRHDEAIKCLNIAVNIKTDFAEAYANLGNAYKEKKLFEMALANYDKAITINSNYAMAFSNRGSILKELNRIDDALASFKKAIFDLTVSITSLKPSGELGPLSIKSPTKISFVFCR